MNSSDTRWKDAPSAVLTGKVAIVTGGSRGIGRAASVALAKAGANVAINYLSNDDDAKTVQDEVRSTGQEALLIKADVADPDAVERMVADVVARFGRLDVAVCNAYFSERELFYEADLAQFRRTVDVTMWGAFFVLRAATRQMIAQGDGGSAVMVSSPRAFIPYPRSMAYNMAKAAVDQMARTAAIELAEHRIRINVVHPGWIDTPGERKFADEKQLAQGGERIPWGRLGRPEEIARAITFLCDPASDYITGGSLLIDGGITLPWWSAESKDK